MGRIKTALVKRVSHELLDKNRDKFKENFDENKKIVEEHAKLSSKKLRNIIAGYITRLMRHKQDI